MSRRGIACRRKADRSMLGRPRSRRAGYYCLNIRFSLFIRIIGPRQSGRSGIRFSHRRKWRGVSILLKRRGHPPYILIRMFKNRSHLSRYFRFTGHGVRRADQQRRDWYFDRDVICLRRIINLFVNIERVQKRQTVYSPFFIRAEICIADKR